MTTHTPRSTFSRGARAGEPPQRISGPAELLQAIPYLLGFHPRRSLVLVGLSGGELVVTARLDLADAEVGEVLADTLQAMHSGGTREIVAAVYDDDSSCHAEAQTERASLPWSGVAAAVTHAAEDVGTRVVEALLVAGERWWSYVCAAPECCPSGGRELLVEPSSFTAAATYAGVVALPDRASLEAVLEPLPDDERDSLAPRIAEAENASFAAILGGRRSTHQRSVKRALFAAGRNSAAPRWSGPPDREVARFAAALGEIPIRDAVWMAIDDRRIDGRALWRDMARRLPAPYDAAPLFLFGWATWRAGDGALAGIAAQRAVDSDPAYSAADLLLAALARGLDPRQFPKLRLPRSA